MYFNLIIIRFCRVLVQTYLHLQPREGYYLWRLRAAICLNISKIPLEAYAYPHFERLDLSIRCRALTFESIYNSVGFVDNSIFVLPLVYKAFQGS